MKFSPTTRKSNCMTNTATRYDQYGYEAATGQAGAGGGFGGGGADFGDIFGSVFGDMFGGGASAGRSRSRRGSDLLYHMELSLEDAKPSMCPPRSAVRLVVAPALKKEAARALVVPVTDRDKCACSRAFSPFSKPVLPVTERVRLSKTLVISVMATGYSMKPKPCR